MSDGTHREIPGRVWLINFCRAAHVAGMAGTATVVLGGPDSNRVFFFVLLAASGVAIAAIDGWTNPAHFRQINGLSTLVKLTLVGLMAGWDAARVPLFWIILLYSVIMSHAPARLRHRRIL